MNKTFLSLILMVLPAIVVAQDLKDYGKSADNLVPSEWEKMIAQGDLNKDGIADLVIIATPTNQENMTTREINEMIGRRVRQSEPTAKVMLFGSRARGDARPDSDWDVMVLLDDASAGKKWEVSSSLFELGWDIDKMVHPIVYTQSEWQKRHIFPFYHNVMRDKVDL